MSHSIKVKGMRSHSYSLIMKKLFRITQAHRAPLNPSISLSIDLCLSVYLSISITIYLSMFIDRYVISLPSEQAPLDCLFASLRLVDRIYLSISIYRSIYIYLCRSIQLSVYSIYIYTQVKIYMYRQIDSGILTQRKLAPAIAAAAPCAKLIGSVYLSIDLSTYRSIDLSISISMYLYISIYSSIQLSIYIYIYIFINMHSVYMYAYIYIQPRPYPACRRPQLQRRPPVPN